MLPRLVFFSFEEIWNKLMNRFFQLLLLTFEKSKLWEPFDMQLWIARDVHLVLVIQDESVLVNDILVKYVDLILVFLCYLYDQLTLPLLHPPPSPPFSRLSIPKSKQKTHMCTSNLYLHARFRVIERVCSSCRPNLALFVDTVILIKNFSVDKAHLNSEHTLRPQ